MENFTQKLTPLNEDIKARKVILKLSDGIQINGELMVPKDMEMNDMFTKSKEPFIVLYNASLRGQMGISLIINKEHIVYIVSE